MKSYSIGHFIDVDGISSQAVLGRSNARRGIETVHIDITYRDPIAALRQATPEQGEIVRFFDFGYGPVLETPEALGEFKRIASQGDLEDRKSTRLNSSHMSISYAVFCLKK